MPSRKPILVTGDRPTGRLHLGHLVGSLGNRIKFQDKYRCFFLIADLHMLTTHFDRVGEVEENTLQLVLDWLSVGMDPNRSTFYIQSQVPFITELHTILSMLFCASAASVYPLKWHTQQLYFYGMVATHDNKSQVVLSKSPQF